MYQLANSTSISPPTGTFLPDHPFVIGRIPYRITQGEPEMCFFRHLLTRKNAESRLFCLWAVNHLNGL